MRLLTKSSFVQGMNCPAYLWHLVNDRESLPEFSEMDRAIMKQGSEVGELAQQLYPGGLGVRGNSDEACLLTQRLLDRGVPLYEAAFQHERLLCKSDIIVPDGDGFRLIEVKSSSRVKDDHLLDIAFQAHVLKKAGIKVTSMHLCHINTGYVRQGELDIEQLFTQEDVTERAAPILETIQEDIERLIKVMDGPRPSLDDHPHGCPLDNQVELPENNVTQLYYNNGRKYLKEGIQLITDIEEGLNKKQEIQKTCIECGEPHVEKDKLKKWLNELQTPIVHLDFETVNPAIPPYDGTRPYEHIPFQFSAHIETEDGITHVEFLGDGKSDPREHLCTRLCELPTSGCYLAHNASFEKRVLRGLAKLFPQHEEFLRKAEQTMHDTIVPFRNFWYYHPDQRGSCSMKALLPALTTISYDDMEIGDGALAQIQYSKLCECTQEEAEGIRKNLLAYCKQDTKAMVEVLKALRNAIQDES